MSALHLDSLEIKNFRCFEHLVIEKLGRVNLIVGKNSVGKTCLLEALWIFGTGATLRVIQKILYDRNELVTYKLPGSMPSPYATDLDAEQQVEGFRKISFGRPKKVGSPITIGSAGTDLKIFFDEFGGGLGPNYHNLSPVITKNKGDPVHYNWLPLPQKDQMESQITTIFKETNVVFIPTQGLSWQTLSTFWDDIALTDMEDSVIESLRIVESAVDKLTFKGESQPEKVRYPAVRIHNLSEPIPMAALGEGISRALGFGLAMTNCSQGYLLIDEFEIGLYHRIQADMWRMIFRLAQQLNIQVFATTHRWNCVEAFQEAAAEDRNKEAMLIRLQKQRSGEGIEAVLYDERRLTIATEENIEVR